MSTFDKMCNLVLRQVRTQVGRRREGNQLLLARRQVYRDTFTRRLYEYVFMNGSHVEYTPKTCGKSSGRVDMHTRMYVHLTYTSIGCEPRLQKRRQLVASSVG